MIKLTKFFSNQYVIFKEFGKIYESNQINFFLNLAHSICVKNSLAIFYLLPYLATVNVFNSCLPKEEENVIFICHGTHKIRSWNTNEYMSNSRHFKHMYMCLNVHTIQSDLLLKVLFPDMTFMENFTNVWKIQLYEQVYRTFKKVLKQKKKKKTSYHLAASDLTALF